MAVSFPSSSRTRKLQNIAYIEEEEDVDSDMEGGRASDDVMLEKRRTWKPEEDEIVLEHVRKHGPHNWSLISSSGLLARPGKSCRTRWIYKLDPNLKKEPLSAEEKRTILQMQSEIGNKWSKIAGCLPGRTDNDVKNFWMGRQNRLARITNRQQQSERGPKRVARLPKTRSQQQKLSRTEEHNGASYRQLPDFGHIKPLGTKPYKERKSNLKSEKSSFISDPQYFIHLSDEQINHSLVEPLSNQLKSTPQCREDSSIESSYNSPEQQRTHPLLQGSNSKKQFTRNSSNMEHNPQRSYFTWEPNYNPRKQNLRSNVFCRDTVSEGFGEQNPEQFPSNGQQPENSKGKESFISNNLLLEPPFFDFPSLPSADILQDIWSQGFPLHLPEKLSSYGTNVDAQESMSLGDVLSDNMDSFLNNVIDTVSDEHNVQTPVKLPSYGNDVYTQERMSMGDILSDNMDGFLNNVIDTASDEHNVQTPVKLPSYGNDVYTQERMSMGDVLSNNMDGFLDNVIDIVSDEHDVQPPVKLLSYMPSDNVQQWPEQNDILSFNFFDELPDIIGLSNWDWSY